MNRFAKLIIAIVLGFIPMSLGAAEIRDVLVECKSGSCAIVYKFDPAGGLPSYFQKYDASRGILKVAFSTTGIKVPMGPVQIDPTSSGLRDVNLKSEATSKGVPLLVFEWSVGPDITSDKNEVILEEAGTFKIKFKSKGNSKKWQLSKASKVTQVIQEPKEKITKEPKVIVEEKPTIVVAPVVFPVETPEKVNTKGVGIPSGIKEISWIRGYGLEQVVIHYADEKPSIARVSDSALFLAIPKATKVYPAIAATGSAIVKEFKVVKASMGGFELQVKLKKATSYQLMQRGSRICLQASVSSPPGLDVWKVDSVGMTHRIFNIANADDDLESLDQFAKGFVQSSQPADQTFKLKKGTRDLIVVEDVVVLRDAPSETGKQMLQLKFGDRLISIDQQKLYYKVKSGDVVGYVNRRMVAFRDELSHLQNEKLQQLILTQKEQQASAEASGIRKEGDSMEVVFDEPDPDRITYSSFGRRDPFVELKGVVNEGINIDGVELVGIIWELEVPMVLLTDSRNPGVSYTLKEGDSILNGKVLKITQDEVLFMINEFGVSRRYTMSLPDKYGGEK